MKKLVGSLILCVMAIACGTDDRPGNHYDGLIVGSGEPASICPPSAPAGCRPIPTCPCGMEDDETCISPCPTRPSPTPPPTPPPSPGYGFFCASANVDTLYACGIDPAFRPYMTAAGWGDAGGGCYHHATSKLCSPVEYAACRGGGAFCDRSSETLTQYICTCTSSPTFGWGTRQPDGCYHRSTGTKCL